MPTLDIDLPEVTAHASAEEIVVRGAVQARGESELAPRRDGSNSLFSGLFSTCPEDNRAWELGFREIDLGTEEGTARGVTFAIKGVTVFRLPYFSFPLTDARKSGFLTPDFSERDRTGIDLRIPYYFDIAPNLDLLLEPRIMSERGTQLRSELGYLLPRSDGELHFEFLPDDEETQKPRRYVNYQHETQFGKSWELVTGIEEVSDDVYFEDFGSSLAVTSQTHLNRYLDVAYMAPYWTLLTRLQNYQTIDPLIVEEDTPYERVPQVLFDGRWFGRLLGFDSRTELANFDRTVGPTGWRLDTTQEVSARFSRPGMYLTPALALRQTNYWLDERETPGDDSLSRTLPVASLDMGLVFERPTSGRNQWLQTLEPRILYVHVPFEDQSALPVFDTILPDFNLVQLFRKYQFVGADRVTDTDQWSIGVTTRLSDPATGRERLTATIGQTRYLNAQRVSLPGDAPNVANASDYVAELSMAVRDAWSIDMGYQWNDATNSTARVETRFEYRPQDDRLFGFGHRYRRSSLEQSDVSFVWPLADRWRVIGRYSYSWLDQEPLEQFVGWEYDACCWRLRMVSRRHVSRRTGEADDSIAIQLELKGFSKGARSADELLDRGTLYRNLSRPN
jgi:LPS-assembly protein